MLKNYISVALRSILKQKIYSFINILGLSIGIAAGIIILLHVNDEWSYDKHFSKSEQVHKVFLERIYPDHITHYAIIPQSYAPVMKTDIPGVLNYTRVFGNPNQSNVIRFIDENEEEQVFEENHVLASDPSFFDIFDIPILEGNTTHPLNEPQSAVITRETALKYFGNTSAIGKVLQTNGVDFKITAVCEDLPENTHFDFSIITQLNQQQLNQNPNFVNFSAHTYLELDKNTQPSDVEAAFPALIDKYAAPQIENMMESSYADYIAAGNGYTYTLQSIEDIHLEPLSYQAAFKSGGNINDVYMFISIAILILVIACINFMNLAIARSTERAKEVGIRKTLGSYKSQLIFQFLTESVLISMISLIIGLLLVLGALPYFNELVDKQLVLDFTSWVVPSLFVFSMGVGLLAGSYPAFFMSAFNTIYVLKGNVKKGKGGTLLRNGLVVFQFTISIILIIGTLIMNNQMNFIKSKDLGFERENILIVERAGVLGTQQQVFIDELKKSDHIQEAGGTTGIPAAQYFGISFTPEGATEPLIANGSIVDDEFLKSLNMRVLEGESFAKERNDSLNIIINERTAKLLGLDDPIGSKLKSTNAGIAGNFTIIGIVKDFHYMSLREEITPYIFLNNEVFNNANNNSPTITIQFTGNPQNTIADVENLWSDLVPKEPLKYSFMNSELEELYKSEINSGKRMTTFSICAIIIACIGLFGLSAYTSGMRTKEIGIRKVVGASVMKIVILLSADFSKLLLLALLLAVPIAWYSMDAWLDGFAYRIDIDVTVFIIAGGLTFVIAWVTVSYQTIKAAILNPVKTLKSE